MEAVQHNQLTSSPAPPLQNQNLQPLQVYNRQLSLNTQRHTSFSCFCNETEQKKEGNVTSALRRYVDMFAALKLCSHWAQTWFAWLRMKHVWFKKTSLVSVIIRPNTFKMAGGCVEKASAQKNQNWVYYEAKSLVENDIGRCRNTTAIINSNY